MSSSSNAPNDELETVAQLTVEKMSQVTQLDVALLVDQKRGKTWAF